MPSSVDRWSSAVCSAVLLSGRMLKRWRRRWFVLQDSTLYSFKKERVYDEPTEIIDLRVFSSVKSSEDYTHRAHSFDVYSTDMVFSMVAPAESDKEGQKLHSQTYYHLQLQQHGQSSASPAWPHLPPRALQSETDRCCCLLRLLCCLFVKIGFAPSVAPL